MSIIGVKWVIAIGAYLLAVAICGAVIFWNASSDHQEPL